MNWHLDLKKFNRQAFFNAALSLLLLTFLSWISFSGNAFAATQSLSNKLKSIPSIPDEAICLPCHGSEKYAVDPALARVYVKKDKMKKSLHKNVLCIQCHTDLVDYTKTYADLGYNMRTNTSKWVQSLFIVMPNGGLQHSAVGPKVYYTANLSCQNCKEHTNQAAKYFNSIHSFITPSGVIQKRPTCNTCHDSHYITKDLSENTPNGSITKTSSKKLCGKCHPKEFESYDDSYHGLRFKSGSPQAPACWDCHGSHFVQSKFDPRSSVSEKNITITCGRCHKDSVASFASYSPMIHGRLQLLNANPIVRFKNDIAQWVDTNILKVVENNYINPLQKYLNARYKQFIIERDKSVTVPTRNY
jgi:hypothetical protein